MIGIEAQNASLTYNISGLSPNVAFEPYGQPKRAVFHLSKGYKLTRDTETIGHAWTAYGSGPGQSKTGTAGDEELGFLQTQEVETLKFFYAGERRSHGSIAINIGPRIVPKTCLDSEDHLDPWTSVERSLASGNTWQAKTGDHPASRCPLRLGNVATNKPNYLFHVIDRRRYFTILTFRLGREFIPLRWFKWSISHNVKFRWVSSKPKIQSKFSTFSFGPIMVGPANSAEIRKITKNPSRPFANYLTRTVISGVVLGHLMGRNAQTTWFANVPGNFWT